MTEPLVHPDIQVTTLDFPSELPVTGTQNGGHPPNTLKPATGDQHGFSGETKSQTRLVLSRFFHQPLAIVGFAVFALLGISTVIVGHFWKFSYSQITNQYNQGPTSQHPFGVDDIGHDMFAQVFRGMEKDIQTALLVMVLSGLIGVTIGALSGFFRGWVDSFLMRIVDLILSIPLIAILIVLSNIWAQESGSWVLIAVIVGALSWTYMARLVRADFLSLREREFVEASRALGASNSRIIVRHLMPNAIATIIVNSTLTVALAIVLESTLSFLGLGIQPPDVSLGLLVSNAQDSATTQWWLFVFPAAFLVILILSIFLVGDGLREAFDPKKTRVYAPDMAEPIVTIENLVVDFPTKDGVVHAVRGIDADLSPGEVLGIVGESGSGKSVTAMATMGLLPKSAKVSGSVRFNETELLGLKEKRLMPVRGKGIAMIFQDPMTSLNPVYSVGWQIAEAIRAHNDISKAEALQRAIKLLDTVGIPNPEERVNNYPHEFSGGMRQRVVIAIAMANDPDVILADEPTTALDVTVQAQVLDALRTALSETHAALLLITHDLGVVAGIADRVLVMYAGRVVELGTVDQIFYEPAMPYTIGLLGSLPRLDAKESDRLRPIPGSPPSMVGHKVGCPFAPRCPLRQPICDQEEPALQPVAQSNGPLARSHLAACHFAEEVHSGEMRPEFQATSIDNELILPESELVSAAEGGIEPLLAPKL